MAFDHTQTVSNQTNKLEQIRGGGVSPNVSFGTFASAKYPES